MNSSQMKMLLLVAIGCILWFISAEGLTDQAWQMMAIFVTTVLSDPRPTSSWRYGLDGFDARDTAWRITNQNRTDWLRSPNDLDDCSCVLYLSRFYYHRLWSTRRILVYL